MQPFESNLVLEYKLFTIKSVAHLFFPIVISPLIANTRSVTRQIFLQRQGRLRRSYFLNLRRFEDCYGQ